MIPGLGPTLFNPFDVVGGVLNYRAQDKTNKTNERIAKENREFQERVLKEGAGWRIADAKKHGVHPAVAMGAPSTSVSMALPANNPNTAIGDTLIRMGQRAHDMQMQRQAAEIQLTLAKKSQIETQTAAAQVSNRENRFPEEIPMYVIGRNNLDALSGKIRPGDMVFLQPELGESMEGMGPMAVTAAGNIVVDNIEKQRLLYKVTDRRTPDGKYMIIKNQKGHEGLVPVYGNK